eukprot:m.84776 g.84776  ORF g.84776 m.84776 type:complete len:81 (+) comp12979_c0_seq7:40-282(+)
MIWRLVNCQQQYGETCLNDNGNNMAKMTMFGESCLNDNGLAPGDRLFTASNPQEGSTQVKVQKAHRTRGNSLFRIINYVR